MVYFPCRGSFSALDESPKDRDNRGLSSHCRFHGLNAPFGATLVEPQPTGAEALLSALFDAINERRPDRVELLLDSGADINGQRAGMTPLLLAAAEDAACLEILARRADRQALAARDLSGCTPLIRAAFLARSAAVEILAPISDIRAEVYRGRSALTMAHPGLSEEAFLLLARGSDLNVANDEGRTPLMEAALFSRPRRVQLLSALCDSGARTREGLTAFDLAVSAERWDSADWLHDLLEIDEVRLALDELGDGDREAALALMPRARARFEEQEISGALGLPAKASGSRRPPRRT